MLAIAASASGILLTGISAWFLGAVALAGLGPAELAFNFHIPAAFVRLFALSKTLGKYGERVVGHRAALLDQVKRRAWLFLAMAQAPATRAAGWQLGNQDRLSDYMEDVEDVDGPVHEPDHVAPTMERDSRADAAAKLKEGEV